MTNDVNDASGAQATTLTVCTTCWNEAHRDLKMGTPDGEAFLAQMQAAASDVPGLEVRGAACLMGCNHGCNLAISAEGKMSYVLGRFDGTADEAAEVVAYATQHAANDAGVVPYRSWPQGVKGHFIARIPPLGRAEQDG